MEPVAVEKARRDTVAVIIPAYNEAESIGRVVSELKERPINRILVVDGGSSDQTIAIAEAAGAETFSVGRGYGLACWLGSEMVTDAEILVFMDGDGADDPTALSAFIGPLQRDEQDFVIGSRNLGIAEKGSFLWHQRLAGSIIGRAAEYISGQRYTDMCAFRAIRRTTLMRLGLKEMTYGWNLEMQLRVAKAGLRIIEVPINNRNRFGGRSKVSGTIGGSLRAGFRIARVFIRFAASKSNFPSAATDQVNKLVGRGGEH
jgi:glycosyltransferase involved in cell wall biosynthesis